MGFQPFSQTAILHTIFFHRFFPALTPHTRDVLDLTLPYVDDDELETMIDQRVAALERQLDAERSSGALTTTATTTTNAAAGTGGRGQMAVQFFEKRRRKAWLSRGDDEVCWECWTVKVTVAEPRTESGAFMPRLCFFLFLFLATSLSPLSLVLRDMWRDMG